MRPAVRRTWDPDWLQEFAGKSGPLPVQFELVNGEMAEGVVKVVQSQGGEVVSIAGSLSAPGLGSFFFRKQSLPGVAGTHVGVVQLPETGRAFRLEPSARDGSPELVSRRLDEVVCLRYAMPPGRSGESASPESSETGAAGSDPQEAPVIDIGQHPTIPTPDYQNGIPVFESLPGARGVIYLDFDGESTTQWGDGTLIVARRSNFNATQIRDIWRQVTADFIGFTINLTTDVRVFERAAENSRIRVIITPTTDAAPGTGGVAFLQSWNWTADIPCWVFNSSVKDAAEAISHEVGHTLGLNHDGRPGEEYYGGHGSGETGWAPIMGIGYGQPVAQWSKGEYANASNREDDLSKIVNDNTSVDYRADDFGASFSAGGSLEIFPGGTVTNRGIIERSTDVDSFRFTTGGGQISLTARPAAVAPNLALRIELINDIDQLLLAVSPTTTLRAVLSTNLPAGSYAVKVRGAGRGANATSGFTAYGSLGYYQITGTVAQAVEPVRLSVAENTPDGTVVGDLNPFASSPGPRVFVATGGNGVGPFALASDGILTVAQSSQLNFEVREQFELLMNIQYPENPLLNETNRRVVVRIDDLNETPALTVNTLRVYDQTRAGTPVGSVVASDPDLYTRLRFAIAEGNDAGWFDVNGSGELRLRRDLKTGPTTFQLRVDAWDAGNPVLTNSVAVAIEVLAVPQGLIPGALAYARYDNIPGKLMANLTNHPRFPRSPSSLMVLTNAEIPYRTGDRYGGAMRGYFLPPVTGTYNFAVAGDDASELRLSTTDRPEDARRIAFSSGFTDWRRWTQNATQRSAAIALEAGRPYYFEARVKEDDGVDHLEVAWSSVAAGSASLQVIPGRYLAPYTMNFSPNVADLELQVHRDAFAGARFGRMEVADANGETDFRHRLLSATPPGLVSLDETNGWLRVANTNLLATTPANSLSLRVRVTDPSGLSSTGTVTCRLVAPASLGATDPMVELFNTIGGGTSVAALTNQARFPRRPDTLKPLVADFSLESNSGNNYGSRVRALVRAPASGSYRFYIASDDSSELWLGTSANPTSARVVARVGGAVSEGSWTAQSAQRSAAITLTANQRYYIESRHKEGTGDDHLGVAWTPPGTTDIVLIPLSSLEPVDLGFAPVTADASATVSSSAASGTVVADLDATDSSLDLAVWRIAGGNEEGIFAVSPDDGTVTVANRSAFQASTQTSWTLQMEVQDSGYGDLYPRRKSPALLTLTRVAGGSPFEDWANAQGIPGARPGDDSDGDGASNLLEFALGGDPEASDAALLSPRLSVIRVESESRAFLTFRRRLDAGAAGLTYLPASASPLSGGAWGPAALDGETTATPAGLPEGYEEVTVRLADAIPSGEAQRFLRVEVTLE